MPKEQLVKKAELTAAAKQPARAERDAPILTEIPAPVTLLGLPLQLARAQVRYLQRSIGNGAVQHYLTAGVVQRGPGEPTPGGAAPIPVLPSLEERRAKALFILKKGLGGRVKVEAEVQGALNESDLREAYDSAMIRMGRTFPAKKGEEPKKWEKGDSMKFAGTSGDFPGFFDPSKGRVMIDLKRPPDEQVATIVHEMIHANASPDFVTKFGRGMDEGMTEKLTRRAFTSAGYAAPTGYFETEISQVDTLGSLFGEGTLEAAYFGGPQIFESMFLGVTDDEDEYVKFCSQVRANNWDWLGSFANRWRQLMGKSEVEKKIGAIQEHLSWLVGSEDVTHVENIIASCTPDEKAQIRTAVLPLVNSLMDHGFRARLRIALG